MFWQLDYAAMDFTGNLPVHTTLLKPSNAIDERGKDVLSILYNDDNQRLEQLEIGNEAIVKYDIPKENAFINNDSEQTICLHSKGYYEKIVDYKGKPDWAQLKPLKHAHSFSGFSLNEYEKSYNNLTIKK
jgi:hypothetical protein